MLGNRLTPLLTRTQGHVSCVTTKKDAANLPFPTPLFHFLSKESVLLIEQVESHFPITCSPLFIVSDDNVGSLDFTTEVRLEFLVKVGLKEAVLVELGDFLVGPVQQ